MTPQLSILIPTLPNRINMLYRLLGILQPQLKEYKIEVLLDSTRGITIGEKRNRMLDQAKGDYICYIDDDDSISGDYVDKVMQGIFKGVDCCSLNGLYRPDNAREQLFVHSIKYKDFYEEDGILVRCPNHLNVVKREHALACKFPDWDRSEDSQYAFRLRDAGLLKTEHVIEGVIYNYEYNSNKRHDYNK